MSNSRSYSELLKDPRWQKKRLEILSRDEFTCQACLEKTKTLHVHHLKYRWGTDPWDYDAADLETLCVDCHQAATEIDEDLKEAKKELLAAWESWDIFEKLMLPNKLYGSECAQILLKVLTSEQEK